MSGIPLQVIGELLGHKTMRMTQRYAHLSPETLQRAAEQGANYLQGKTNVTRLHLVDGEDGERSDAKDPGSMTLKPELRTKGLEVPTKGAELRTKAPELRT